MCGVRPHERLPVIADHRQDAGDRLPDVLRLKQVLHIISGAHETVGRLGGAGERRGASEALYFFRLGELLEKRWRVGHHRVLAAVVDAQLAAVDDLDDGCQSTHGREVGQNARAEGRWLIGS